MKTHLKVTCFRRVSCSSLEALKPSCPSDCSKPTTPHAAEQSLENNQKRHVRKVSDTG